METSNPDTYTPVVLEASRQHVLLTVTQVAAILGIGDSTAYRLVGKSPDFPKAVKVGGQWRIPQAQLDRFIAGDAGERAAAS